LLCCTQPLLRRSLATFKTDFLLVIPHSNVCNFCGIEKFPFLWLCISLSVETFHQVKRHPPAEFNSKAALQYIHINKSNLQSEPNQHHLFRNLVVVVVVVMKQSSQQSFPQRVVVSFAERIDHFLSLQLLIITSRLIGLGCSFQGFSEKVRQVLIRIFFFDLTDVRVCGGLWLASPLSDVLGFRRHRES